VRFAPLPFPLFAGPFVPVPRATAQPWDLVMAQLPTYPINADNPARIIADEDGLADFE
jgi:hypothetical protein